MKKRLFAILMSVVMLAGAVEPMGLRAYAEEARGYAIAAEEPLTAEALTEETLTEEALTEEPFMEEPPLEKPMAEELLTVTPESDFTWDGTTITGYIGIGYYGGEFVDIVIPAKAEKIGDYAFQNGSYCLKSVAFEEGSRLETIGKGAFAYCTNLQSVVIPENVTTIGDQAFGDDYSLATVDIRTTKLTDAGSVPFTYCAISEILWPEGITEIPEGLFANECFAEGMSLKLPDTVEVIGKGAFGYNPNLQEVTLPKNLKRIESDAFRDCDLRSLEIPENVTAIGSFAFNRNKSLAKLVIRSKKLVTIGDEGDIHGPFYGGQIKELVWPDGITEIPDRLFRGGGFASGTALTFPATIKEIGASAFQDASELQSVTFPLALERIDDGAFLDCTGLQEVIYEGSEAQWNALVENGSISRNSNDPIIRPTKFLAAEAHRGFDYTKDGFCFDNSRFSFFADKNTKTADVEYTIPFSRFQEVYGNNTTRSLYIMHDWKSFDGYCFGMSAVAAQLYAGKLDPVSYGTEQYVAGGTVNDTMYDWAADQPREDVRARRILNYDASNYQVSELAAEIERFHIWQYATAFAPYAKDGESYVSWEEVLAAWDSGETWLVGLYDDAWNEGDAIPQKDWKSLSHAVLVNTASPKPVLTDGVYEIPIYDCNYPYYTAIAEKGELPYNDAMHYLRYNPESGLMEYAGVNNSDEEAYWRKLESFKFRPISVLPTEFRGQYKRFTEEEITASLEIAKGINEDSIFGDNLRGFKIEYYENKIKTQRLVFSDGVWDKSNWRQLDFRKYVFGDTESVDKECVDIGIDGQLEDLEIQLPAGAILTLYAYGTLYSVKADTDCSLSFDENGIMSVSHAETGEVHLLAEYHAEDGSIASVLTEGTSPAGDLIKVNVDSNGQYTLDTEKEGTYALIYNCEDAEVEKKDEAVTGETPFTADVKKELASEVGLHVSLANADATYVYTGAAICPAVIVKNNGTVLTENVDYKLSYSNNTKVSTEKKPASVTVTGLGNFGGKAKAEFMILPKSVSVNDTTGGTAGVCDNRSYTAEYSEGALFVKAGEKAVPILTYGGYTLTAKDYTVVSPTGAVSEKDTELKISGKGNFAGERVIPLVVLSERELKSFTIKVEKETDQTVLQYNGTPRRPTKITVKDKTSGAELTEGTDYEVRYPADIVNVGKVTFTVVGLGAYAGSATGSYKILPRAEKDGSKFTVALDSAVYTPGGVAPAMKLHYGELLLTSGKDYKVSYSSNKKAGTGKYIVSFLGNFKGSKKLQGSFTIDKAPLGTATVAVADQLYTKPGTYASAPAVYYDGKQVAASEYTVTYTDSTGTEISKSHKIDLSTGDEAVVTVRVTAKEQSSFTGSATATYTVRKSTEKQSYTDLSKAKITICEKGQNNGKKLSKAEYTGRVITFDPTKEDRQGDIVVTIGKGANMKTLVYGTDYTVVYSDNVQKGKASARITGVASRGYVGSKTAKFTIGTKNVSALSELLKKLFGGN